MNNLKRTAVTRFALPLLLAFSCAGAGAQAPFPEGEFVCQVRAEGGKIGLVMIQADSKEVAIKAAVGANAQTTDGFKARATGVIQCITYREERFTDVQFQAFFDQFPL